MNDKDLMKASVLVSILGILLLFYAVQVAEPRKASINSLTQEDVGANIEISGVVEKVSKSDGNIFLTVDDGSEIKVVIFERVALKINGVQNATEGKNVTVIGKINIYMSDLEIIASSIKVL